MKIPPMLYIKFTTKRLTGLKKSGKLQSVWLYRNMQRLLRYFMEFKEMIGRGYDIGILS